MLIREEIEKREIEILSPLAAKSAYSKGRAMEEEKCHMRTDFQRDRDRIIHSKAFRRLMHKTQVFLAPEGDHFRTRLTHTIEVSQIARTIARSLNLNEDLTEAIALGHDLGHTPFGHNGEDVLNSVHPGGFEHNVQSLRVADVLESTASRTGMNLTAEVRDGMVNHTGPIKPFTLEGQIVRRSDQIAYVNHDIDDAVRAGVISLSDLPRKAIKQVGLTHGERVGNMIKSVVRHSEGKNEAAMEPEIWDALLELREFMFERVYSRDWANDESRKTHHIITELVGYYMDHPGQMPNEYMEIVYREGTQRGVCDYVACMTDAYAVKTYQKLFIPPFFDGIG